MNQLTLALGPLGTNCYLLWDQAPGPALLVDCAGSAEEILREADARGLRIATIVLTHGHMDHIECLTDLAARTAAEIAIHGLDAPMLSDPMLSGAALFGYSQSPLTPGRLLAEGDKISLPETTLQFSVLHTLGHTPGSICLSAPGLLFSGDTLFAGSIGRMDLPGGDEEQMAASLRRLLELPDATLVYPGHGPATSIGEERDSNPWLGGW